MLAALSVSGCFAFVTKEEGRELKQQIDDVRTLSAKNELRAAELAKELDEQLKRLRAGRRRGDQGGHAQLGRRRAAGAEAADRPGAADRAHRRSAARAGRAHQAVPGLPRGVGHQARAAGQQLDDGEESADAGDARRALRRGRQAPGGAAVAGRAAAVRRRSSIATRPIRGRRARSTTSARRTPARSATPTPSAPTRRWSTTSRRATWCPTRCTRTALAFYALKYCGDAKVYFQELLKRYPKTNWKKDAGEELKKLTRDQKNKAVCAS